MNVAHYSELSERRGVKMAFVEMGAEESEKEIRSIIDRD